MRDLFNQMTTSIMSPESSPGGTVVESVSLSVTQKNIERGEKAEQPEPKPKGDGNAMARVS